MIRTPNADDHKFARIVAENDPTATKVRKVVGQYNRGMLTERELLLALADIDPNDIEEVQL